MCIDSIWKYNTNSMVQYIIHGIYQSNSDQSNDIILSLQFLILFNGSQLKIGHTQQVVYGSDAARIPGT